MNIFIEHLLENTYQRRIKGIESTFKNVIVNIAVQTQSA